MLSIYSNSLLINSFSVLNNNEITYKNPINNTYIKIQMFVYFVFPHI